MVNKPKIKGTRAESAVVAYLRAHGFPGAERRALSGSQDRGDVSGVLGHVLEVKNCAQMSLGAWVDEAEVERANDGAEIGVCVHHRRGKGDAGEWFVTQPLAQWVAERRRFGYGEPIDNGDAK